MAARTRPSLLDLLTGASADPDRVAAGGEAAPNRGESHADPSPDPFLNAGPTRADDDLGDDDEAGDMACARYWQEDPDSAALPARREAIRRDLQNLLNTRRPWRTLPPAHAALRATIRGYGLPDFTSSAFNAAEQREALLHDIAVAIADFEPRLTRVRVTLRAGAAHAAPALSLRIEAMLRGAPGEAARLRFDTLIDSATTDMLVKATDE